MNKERLLATFLDLVQITSPSKQEAAVAAYCKTALEQAGCSVHIDDTTEVTGSNTGNLIATLSGTLPGKLYFSAHMDTVNPGESIIPVITDGVIRSSGDTILGGDDKVGVAAIIELVRTLSEESRPHPDIGVMFSVCEEISLLGALSIDASNFHEEPCFVLDGEGKPGSVTIGSPHHSIFRATFTGKAAHAGVEPEKGLSAIKLAAKAILDMELGRIDEYTTANVGTISGGNAINVVPGSCAIAGEFRVMDESKLAGMQAQLESAMNNAIDELGGEVCITWDKEFPGYQHSKDDPLVQMVLKQAGKLGFEAKTMFSGGMSDANAYTGGGLKALVLGTGMTDVHSLNESLAIQDLEDLARLCIAISYAYSS